MHCRSPAEDIEQVTYQIARGDLTTKIHAHGYVYSPGSIQIVPKSFSGGGYDKFVVVWAADQGIKVKKGDPIIKLSSAQLDDEVIKATDKLHQKENTILSNKLEYRKILEEASLTVKLKMLDLEKAQLDIIDHPSVPKNEQRKALLSVNKAKRALKFAKSKKKQIKKLHKYKLTSLELDLDTLKKELDNLEQGKKSLNILAPETGYFIYKVFWAGGNWVKLSMGVTIHSGRTLAEVVLEKPLLVKIFLPEIDNRHLSEGDPVDIFLTMSPTTKFSGKIRNISKIPQSQNDRRRKKIEAPYAFLRTFELVIEVADWKDKPVVSGLSAQMRFQKVSHKNALIFPVAALPLMQEKSKEKVSSISVQKKTVDGWQALTLNLVDANDSSVVLKGDVQEGDRIRFSTVH